VVFQWSDPIQRMTKVNVIPVYHQLVAVLLGPQRNQAARCSRLDLALEQIAFKVEGRSLSLMFGMKMRRRMIPKIHADGDAEKGRNLRHRSLDGDNRDRRSICQATPLVVGKLVEGIANPVRLPSGTLDVDRANPHRIMHS
jgi:hypothetical protein